MGELVTDVTYWSLHAFAHAGTCTAIQLIHQLTCFAQIVKLAELMGHLGPQGLNGSAHGTLGIANHGKDGDL